MAIIFQKRKSRLRTQGGFGLIEAMVAIVIFAIGILGAYKLQLHATLGNTLANRVSTSTMWAVYAIEELLAKEYEDFQDIDASGDPGYGYDGINVDDDNADGVLYVLRDGSKSSDSTDSANALYTVYWNVAEGDSTTDGTGKVMKDVKLVRIQVFRKEGIRDRHLYTHNYYRTVWPE